MAEQAVQIILGAHFYQPDRIGYHDNVRDFNTSPDGLDWTDIGRQRVYQQLGRLGLYSALSYDYAPPLRREMTRVAAKYEAGEVAEARSISDTISQMEQYVEPNGIATTAVHVIQPHLSHVDKQILVQAGIQDYLEMADTPPAAFWLPEGAVDDDTLEVLSENNIQAFICAPEQVRDDHPRRISLASGRHIIALPFDSEFSRELAFDKDRRSNAQAFIGRFVVPIVTRRRHDSDTAPIILFADGETYGMYDKQKEADPTAHGSDRFLEYAVRQGLPDIGVETVSINEAVRRMVTNPQQIPEGYVRPNTAWSSTHELARWERENSLGGVEGAEWKPAFYTAHAQLHDAVTQLVRR